MRYSLGKMFFYVDFVVFEFLVSRYQDEHAKKTIIRLEQCARSAMQRAIASRGALAVFYGHHVKHYIKQTEVLYFFYSINSFYTALC